MWIGLAVLIFFELVADVLAKEWTIRKLSSLAIASIACYVIANTSWLYALLKGAGLARGAVFFGVSSGVIASFLGIVIYNETLTTHQIIGIVLGLASISLLV